MKTRTITEIQIYTLHLNSIYANYESSNLVAVSHSAKDLIDWYDSQKIEPVNEGGMYFNFKEGPLRNYNPFDGYEHCGISEDWATAEGFNNYYNSAVNSFGCITTPELIGCDEFLNPLGE